MQVNKQIPFDLQVEQLRRMMEERLRFLEGYVAVLMQLYASRNPQPAVVIFARSKEAVENLRSEIEKMKEIGVALNRLKESYIEEKKRVAEKMAEMDRKKEEIDIALKVLKERLKVLEDRLGGKKLDASVSQ